MISQALGLLLTGTLLGLVSGVYRNAMVSEDAAQTAARAYFLIDILSHWSAKLKGKWVSPPRISRFPILARRRSECR